MAASVRRVILLGYDRDGVTYALRGAVPAGQESAYRQPEYVSSANDPLDPDLVAIREGTVAEEIETNNFSRRSGETAGQFRARVEATLQTRWADWNAALAQRLPRQLFGRFWNGTTWSAP